MARRHRQLSFNDRRRGPSPLLIGLLASLAVAAVFAGALRRGLADNLRVPVALLRFAAGNPPPVPGDPALGPAELAAAPTVAIPDPPATATPPPTPAPAPAGATAAEIAADWAARWSAADYAGLYSLLDDATRRQVSSGQFIERYEAISQRAGLTAVAARPAGEIGPDGAVPLAVRFDSSLVGPFDETVMLPLRRQQSAWRVAWTPAAIFPQLERDRCVDIDQMPVGRGSILDRNGEPLAYDGSVWRVSVITGQMLPGDEPRVRRQLANLTGLTESAVHDRYKDADPGWLTPIKDFPPERELDVLNAVRNLPGVSVTEARGRVYPLGRDAAHLTGYVSEPTAEQLAANPGLQPGQPIGQAGVEAGADDLLTGTPGARIVAVECESRAELAEIAVRPAVAPRDVQLTVDAGFQRQVAAALRSIPDRQGAAVVLDPATGAVLALASMPDYDPNGFVIGFDRMAQGDLRSELRRPLLDRATDAAYPAGSVFKAVTFAAAMEHLDYAPDTVLDCPSTFALDGASQRWDDWTVAEGLGAQGPMTLHRALVTSCNTVFYAIGRDLDARDPDLLPAMARAFGFGEPTGIPDFPETGGLVPNPAWKRETFGDGWATGDSVNLAIGQGALQVTPLQMAVAYAAIANGGDLLQPWVVAAAIGPGGERTPLGGRTTRGRLPLAPSTIAALQDALRDQTTDVYGAGSSRIFADFPWPIAGKTGTAQNLESPSAKPHSWFAAFGPWGGTPELASAAIVESAGEGVQFAAPITRAIYEAWISRPQP
ncbi:MAG: penicillin-binding transpeptidase domain-containing protein [Chloroflexota bacterium]